MSDTDTLALIHAEIDGELDDRQRAELARQLLSDPKLRALRVELRHLCTALDAFVPAKPPPQLRADILDALPQSTRPPARWQAPAWRYAALLAGVVVAATILYEAGSGRRPPAGDLSGTLAAAVATLDSVQLGNGPIAGRVSLYRDHDGFGLEFKLSAGEPVDVEISSGGETLRLNGLRAPGGPAAQRVALPAAAQAGQPVELKFEIAGREVSTATLRIPQGK